jgi:hypothetical protein
MTHFLFDLVSNLALLVIVRIACHLYNRFTSGPAVNGSDVFATLALLALLLDAALTFFVFADAEPLRPVQFARCVRRASLRAGTRGRHRLRVALRRPSRAAAASERGQTGCDPYVAVFGVASA